MLITREIIDFSNKLADLGEGIAQKYFRQENGEVQKDDQSPVTKADREIEEVLRAEIEKQYPEHGIIGEEYGIKNEDAEFKWVIDPIDGTSSFIIGRPTFGTLIALCYQGKPVIGIVNQPITKERWLGVDDEELGGAWFNGKAIKTRDCTQIKDAVISTTSPFFFDDDGDAKRFDALCKAAKYQKYGGVIYGGDCYSYALLASGFVDIIVEPNLQIYDYAALVPIIRMAGGAIGDYEKGELGMRSGVKLLACANLELYEKVLKYLNG